MDNDGIAVSNPTDLPMAVGAHTVAPGETRIFPANQVPAYLRPQPPAAEPEPVDEWRGLRELATGTVKEVTARLPELTLDELDALETIENESEAPRKGVLSGLAEARLARVNREQAINDLTEQMAGLETLEQFAELQAAHADDEELVQIIDTEAAQRFDADGKPLAAEGGEASG